MKLSQLIAYRNAIQDFSVGDVQIEATMELDKIMHEVYIHRIQLPANAELEKNLSSINLAFSMFKQNLDMLRVQIDAKVKLLEKPYFNESYELYEKSREYDTNEYILKRRTSVSVETEELIYSRVKYYGDWRYPGMLFRPGSHDLITHMVSYDPLYIIDDNQELLEPAISKFPEQYQKRLCTYYFDENNENFMPDVPDNQFGICVAYDFFNFKPIEVLKKYLSEIYAKLRPGGVLAMTFNDCDHVAAMILVENYFGCYTPGKLVIDTAEDLGFELIYEWHKNGEPVTWVELRKPGQLTSLRGGQTLAKIVRK